MGLIAVADEVRQHEAPSEATRASHQLWCIASDEASKLVTEALPSAQPPPTA
jgi:hypothetical protein